MVYRAPADGPYHRDLTLRRDGAWVVPTDALTGRVLGSHRLAALRGIAIEGAYGAVDNTLTVDLSGGPIDVARGISWDGGVGGYNTLDVRGGGVTRASDLALGPHSGVYTLGSTRITYSHIAPITDNTPATVYTFIMPSATTSVIVSTGALPGTLTINCLEGSSPSAEQPISRRSRPAPRRSVGPKVPRSRTRRSGRSPMPTRPPPCPPTRPPSTGATAPGRHRAPSHPGGSANWAVWELPTSPHSS
jgi:hypothetical protein